MSYGTALVDTIQSSTTGTPTQFNDGSGTQIGTLCRAWVNFNGTTSPGTIRASFNVGSVTKNGTGLYTINFTNAMPDANYSIVSMAKDANTSALGGVGFDSSASPTTTTVRVSSVSGAGSYYDYSYMMFSIFR